MKEYNPQLENPDPRDLSDNSSKQNTVPSDTGQFYCPEDIESEMPSSNDDNPPLKEISSEADGPAYLHYKRGIAARKLREWDNEREKPTKLNHHAGDLESGTMMGLNRRQEGDLELDTYILGIENLADQFPNTSDLEG